MAVDPKHTKDFSNLWQIKLAEINPSIFALQKCMQEIMEPVVKLAQIVESIRVPALKIALPYIEKFAKFFQAFELSRRLDESGWLPHYTTPYELIQENTEDIRATLEDHYRTNWPEVRKAIEESVSAFDLDEESRIVINEILDAHENGHYRSVCRTIFPEIERLSRLEFSADNYFNPLSNQKDLREMAGALPVRGGLEAIAMFERLFNHIYKDVKTMEALQAVQNDPVPNRHACLHGLVIYNTHQSSINSIFFLEYIFWIYNYAKDMQKLQNANNQPA
jgi:hypothetical protein